MFVIQHLYFHTNRVIAPSPIYLHVNSNNDESGNNP